MKNLLICRCLNLKNEELRERTKLTLYYMYLWSYDIIQATIIDLTFNLYI